MSTRSSSCPVILQIIILLFFRGGVIDASGLQSHPAKKTRLSGYERLFQKTEKLEYSCLHVLFSITMLKVFLKIFTHANSANTVGSSIRMTARDFVHGKATALFKQLLAQRNVDRMKDGEYDHKDFCRSIGGSCVHVKEFWGALKDILPEAYSTVKDQSYILEASSNCAILCSEDREWYKMLSTLPMSSCPSYAVEEAPLDLSVYDDNCLRKLDESYAKAMESDRLLQIYDRLKKEENSKFLMQAASQLHSDQPANIDLIPIVDTLLSENLITEETNFVFPEEFTSPPSPPFIFPKTKKNRGKVVTDSMQGETVFPPPPVSTKKCFESVNQFAVLDEENEDADDEDEDDTCSNTGEYDPADYMVKEAGNTYIIWRYYIFINDNVF